tara:strand:- start:865 stop:1341 length:477 start_codon:yes stop_codon:yes gene_type:complete
VSKTEAIKRALAFYHLALHPETSDVLSDTLTCAHGINTFFNTKEAIHPPSNTEKAKDSGFAKEEEEEEISSNTNTTGFERWWSTYPLFNGYKPGKSDCSREWDTQGLDDEVNEIVEATKRFKGSKSWRDGYVPMPLTFLTKRRWLDAPPREEEFFIVE